MEDNSKADSSGPDPEAGEEFRIELTESDSYTIHPASTARGGVQMRGDFLIEFFIERYKDPGAEVYSLNSEGELDEHIRSEAYDSAVLREKQTGVMMSQMNAFNLATWIIANILGDGVTDADVEDVIASAFEDRIENTGDSE